MSVIMIAAVGIFAAGIAIGVLIAMVSYGIRREERRYQEARRSREEQGIWDELEMPERFLPLDGADGVSRAARRLNGLYIRERADLTAFRSVWPAQKPRAVRVTRPAGRLVAVAARLLPTAERARYYEEYRSDLWHLIPPLYPPGRMEPSSVPAHLPT